MTVTVYFRNGEKEVFNCESYMDQDNQLILLDEHFNEMAKFNLSAIAGYHADEPIY